MSISKWSKIHPFVADRVRAILNVADRHGGKYAVTSGYRSVNAQWVLRRDPRGFPVADPGCSQHQYGLAMDVAFSDFRWQEWYQQSARNLGLSSIPNDAVHVAAIPSSKWVPFIHSTQNCPHPDFIGRLPLRNNFSTGGSFCSLSSGPWPGVRCHQWSPTPINRLA